MNVLIQLSHPAHFHLYKIVAKNLMEDGNKVLFVIKSKDILETLLQNAGLPYVNINQHAHRGSKFGILWDMFVREWRIIKLCRKHKIDLITGSTPETAHVSWLLRIHGVNTGEDDLDVVPAFKKIAGPVIQCFVAPDPCDAGPVENRTAHYPGYHELAYLHPNHFTPSADVVTGYGIDVTKPYFVMRFASLNAHHDTGIKGINTDIAKRLIGILENSGSACSLSDQLVPFSSACSLSADSGNKPRIYITSERPLEPQFEKYRIKINPLDMHHVMAFASLYIGDSQTMAAEAGVLGVPFVRFNDFVGRIGYLRELEDKYELGYGIKASAEGSVEKLCERVEALVTMKADERKATFAARRSKMLEEKIDCAKFLTWFIENYPSSASEVKNATPDFWERFK